MIVGNPPYIFARGEQFKSYEKDYFYSHYKEQNYQLNTYPLFIEHGINLLAKDGMFGYIVPSNWLTIGTLKAFRNYIISNTRNLKIVNYAYKVFDGANVDTATIIFEKGKPNTVSLNASPEIEMVMPVKELDYKDCLNLEAINFSANANNADQLILKIEKHNKLGAFTLIKSGLKAYQVGKGNPIQNEEIKKTRRFHSTTKKDGTFGRYLQGADVKRYQADWSGEWLSYGDWLAEPRRSLRFTGQRILIRQIPSKLPYMINAVIVNDECYHDINSMAVLDSKYDLRYVLGILNSKLISFWFDHKYQKLQRGIFPQFKVNELANFPIAYNVKHETLLIQKVDEMLALKTDSKTADKNYLLQRISGLDAQIDRIVYQIYDLTEQEIAIIESLVATG